MCYGFYEYWYSICITKVPVKILIEVSVMLINQQSSNRRLIYSVKQMRSFQNPELFNNNIEHQLSNEIYDGGHYYLLDSDENESYVLGYN